ncbi:hypothetical protein EVAR_76016_1 [Eumeta japonica]|uniref:Uncharacterized protein n=1 Tax=Eumeta variegata TaxID=151549 RepID=A0A4C1UA91_EUMVA|nr:hypothetical protein EVAR_76016_1 [Eumeta japonica]
MAERNVEDADGMPFVNFKKDLVADPSVPRKRVKQLVPDPSGQSLISPARIASLSCTYTRALGKSKASGEMKNITIVMRDESD